ncbi:hypothetical protein GCM10023238_10540 [Streptomyces heliomycini]
MLYPLKGVGTLQVTDEAVLRGKYGVDGKGYADLALLRGDPSDGLPGVPGIGEKTAAKLLAEFGDLAGILAAVDDRQASSRPSQRKRTGRGATVPRGRSRVVRVADDVPLPDVDTALPRGTARPRRASPWPPVGLGGSLQRLLTTLSGVNAHTRPNLTETPPTRRRP